MEDHVQGDGEGDNTNPVISPESNKNSVTGAEPSNLKEERI